MDLAYEFINYTCQYEAAYDNSSYVGYTASNMEAQDELAEGEFAGIESYVPRSDNPNDEVFTYNENTRKTIADLWSRVKIAASNAAK